MFDLTPQERQVILFLVTIGLVGFGADVLVKRYAPLKTLVYFHEDADKVDLNTADKGSLVGISGIGEKLAQQIIKYRNEHGSFSDVDELRNIEGITEYRYEKIKDALCIK